MSSQGIADTEAMYTMYFGKTDNLKCLYWVDVDLWPSIFKILATAVHL